MPLRPTREYLTELERLGAGPADESRGELLARVTDLFLLTVDRQTHGDRIVFGQVLERLAHGADIAARAELAMRLAGAPTAPLALIRRLAGDEIAVARPLLEGAAALSDADLAAIARTAGEDHAEAIARRPALNRALTDVLAVRGDDVVLQRMADNAGARFSRNGIELMARRAARNAALRDALAARADLPENIRARLLSRRDLDEPAVAADPAPLDEAALAHAARAGRAAEAVRVFASLTGLEPAQAEHCLLRAEMTSLTVLCKAQGLAATTFSALLQLRVGASAIAPQGVAGAMRRYETMDTAAARRIQHVLCGRLARRG